MKEEAAMEAVKAEEAVEAEEMAVAEAKETEEHVRVEVASDPVVEKEDRVVRARMIMGR